MSQLSLLNEFPEPKVEVPTLPVQSFQFKVTRVGEPIVAPKADQPELCVDYWHTIMPTMPWFDENKEHLIVLMLDSRLHITGHALVSVGTLNETIAHPRDVFRPVIIAGANAFVLMHNHPSGDSSPSQADHSLTRRLGEGAELLRVALLDHCIVGKPADGRQSYFSFREAGVL